MLEVQYWKGTYEHEDERISKLEDNYKVYGLEKKGKKKRRGKRKKKGRERGCLTL